MEILLVGLLLFPIVLGLTLVIPRWTVAAGIGMLSVLFRAVSFLGTPVYLVAAVIIPLVRWRRIPVYLRSFRMFATAVLAAAIISTITTFWSSRPDISLQTGGTWLAILLLASFFAVSILTDGISSVGKFLIFLLPAILAQAVSTIVFRFSPAIEESYYRSAVSTVFIGRLGQDMYSTEFTNNVLNPDRSGGFLFVNLNRASMVMGVFLIAYLAYGWINRKRWIWFAVIPLAAAIATGGSKTGLALLIAIPVYSGVLALASRSDRAAQRMGIVLTFFVTVAFIMQTVLSTADDYVIASERTLLPRIQLWSEALRAIGDNWLIGLGFGGWEDRWQSGGVRIAFSMRPPHNWVLQAWLDGGLAYIAVSAAYVVVIVVMQMRAVRSVDGIQMKFAMALAGSGLLWPIVHSLGDNSAVFGDPPALAFVGLLAALLLTGQHIASGEARQPLMQSGLQSPTVSAKVRRL